MNKIFLYVGLAILLGTVTMVAPIALLQNDNLLNEGQFTVKTTSAPIGNQTRETCNSSYVLGLDSTYEPYSALPPSEPEITTSSGLPEEPQATSDINSGDSGTDLSPVALITIPGFLVALGIFVILRRQVS